MEWKTYQLAGAPGGMAVLSLGDSIVRPDDHQEQETPTVLLPVQGAAIEQVDALTRNWDALLRYAYPPIAMTPISGGDPGGPILVQADMVPVNDQDAGGPPQEVARWVEPPEELGKGECFLEPSKIWLVA